ncbi:heterokaryon incompatibility protein-domain-containing protein [Hypoxylon sp. FL1857]|nr:heterokaryon incompatibility protein-domain-containing protein [Hypoxylon sp. FL1857]
MPASIYEPLDRTKKEIRLLYLSWNGHDDEVLSCRMITASLTYNRSYRLRAFLSRACARLAGINRNQASEYLPYAALSYVWGGPKLTEEITINGTKTLITNSLATALRRLRKTELFRGPNPLPIWADGICINQKDPTERGDQVKLMGVVFSSARYVLSWLGEPSGGPDDLGFDVVREIADYVKKKAWNVSGANITDDRPLLMEGGFEWMAGKSEFYALDSDGPIPNIRWNAALNLRESPYFKRVWIVQEVALASRPNRNRLLYGDEYVTYQQLKQYNDFLLRMEREQLSKPSIMPADLWEAITSRFNLKIPLIMLLGAQQHYRDNFPEDIAWQVSKSCFSTDPLDTIYGLLGLMSIDMEPDYRKPVADVYKEWFARCLSRHKGNGVRDLRILDLAGIGYNAPGVENLPSWVANLGMSEERKRTVIEVGYLPRGPWYDSFDTGLPAMKSGDVLSIRGVLLDTISIVNLPPPEDDIEKLLHWFWWFCVDYLADLGGARLMPSGLLPLQTVLAVLFLGEVQTGTSKESFPLKPTHPVALDFFRLLAEGSSPNNRRVAAARLGLSSPDDIEDFLFRRFCNPDEEDADQLQLAAGVSEIPNTEEGGIYWPWMVVAILERHKNAIFRTEGRYLGAGPPGTLPRDVVCLLSGVDMPTVLRRMDESTWAFVGVSYVEGLSNNEPVHMIRDGVLHIEEFNLR